MAFSFGLSFLGDPRSTLHKLLSLKGLRRKNVLSTTQTSIKLSVLFDKHTALPFNFVVGKRGLHLVCSVVVLSTDRGSNSRVSTRPLNHTLQLAYFDSVLVLHARQLS